METTQLKELTELKGMMWWWLSFVKDGEFAGVAIVLAPSMETACSAAWALKLNPGGEVKGMPTKKNIRPEYAFKFFPPDEARKVAALPASELFVQKEEIS